ncbi:glycosyltransferase [Roseinatronobacter alkalisoli]|uniref:Glycosyltransferase family A protein n=1 Tax=Roseinatronobacter alkalisoli TaxID=3028235 RepID=A0ABT5T8I7_9RHOB|nr:glycosyltransferase family A protein [Roseinatronobacter sp. HJB301]MDD7971437.1 glycosyltransferase family A protein [Roseinatronobacter sp. HJB301]
MGAVQFDAIVIGRNEGDRLVRALAQVTPEARRVVYVDSGSTDDSVAHARAAGAQVVDLDPARPFTAARARNEGFAALGDDPAEFVHFIDGDCILAPDWPATALAFLQDHPKAALVHGYHIEDAPDASVYNWLTDQEWKMATGPDARGLGTFMGRSAAFAAVGGFRDDMIAAEDDELFFRLRKSGWQTWCVPDQMSGHDVRLLKFAGWFRRMIRAGHSFSELGVLHSGAARAPRLRAVFWAGVLPVLALLGLWLWPPLSALVLALYALSLARLWRRSMAQGLAPDRAVKAAALLVICKFANLYGMATYWIRRFRRSDAKIIEYK